MTTDMKAAIEKVRKCVSDDFTANDFITEADLATVLALAEIGRLAVECRLYDDSGRVCAKGIEAEERLFETTTAFLARREGGK